MAAMIVSAVLKVPILHALARNSPKSNTFCNFLQEAKDVSKRMKSSLDMKGALS